MQVESSKPLYSCCTQVGKSDTLLKALLHAGRGKQSPNPCFTHDGKSNPKSSLHVGWEIRDLKSLLHAGWESKKLKSLLHASWELRYPSPRPLQIFATWKFRKPKHSNPCYMQVWKPKHSNPCCTQVEEAPQPSLKLLATCNLRDVWQLVDLR